MTEKKNIENSENDESNAIEIDTKTNTFAWIDDFILSDEEINNMSSPEWLYPNLIIKGHVVAIVAPPNGGKTTLMMHIASKLAESVKVIYVNADVSSTDAIHYMQIAKDKGFKLLLPDIVLGKSINDIGKKLEEMASDENDYSNIVIIIDTLKKMTDIINKNISKKLYQLFRSLSGKGVTIILLGHTNKHKVDGKDVFEGTGDLRADVDELIYLDSSKNNSSEITISTKPDKVRGSFEPITFIIDGNRNVSQTGNYTDVSKLNEYDSKLKDEASIIEAINTAIDTGNSIQSDIIKYCQDKYSLGKRSVKRVLDYFTNNDNPLWLSERGATNNRIIYKKIIE
jgi:predicted ATP-dependent serine protease